jgi:hypothetical protein
MLKPIVKRAIASLMVVNLLGPGLFTSAQAGLIGTQASLAMEQRQGRLERVQGLVLRQEVQSQMVAMGVDPAAVQERLAALTDEELQTLEGRLDSLPAGGDALAVVGIVFVVLIILELVGVTNIFTKM